MRRYLALLLILGALVGGAAGFAAPGAQTSIRTSSRGVAANRAPIAPGLTFMTPSLHTQSASVTALYAGDDGADPGEIIAKRIVVTGDVDGGYYRSCVKNEVSVPNAPTLLQLLLPSFVLAINMNTYHTRNRAAEYHDRRADSASS